MRVKGLRVCLYSPEVLAPCVVLNHYIVKNRVHSDNLEVYLQHLIRSECLLNCLPGVYLGTRFLKYHDNSNGIPMHEWIQKTAVRYGTTQR